MFLTCIDEILDYLIIQLVIEFFIASMICPMLGK